MGGHLLILCYSSALSAITIPSLALVNVRADDMWRRAQKQLEDMYQTYDQQHLRNITNSTRHTYRSLDITNFSKQRCTHEGPRLFYFTLDAMNLQNIVQQLPNIKSALQQPLPLIILYADRCCSSLLNSVMPATSDSSGSASTTDLTSGM